MTIFNRQRLTDAAFKLDIERMRRGWYSDKYFENVTAMLEQLARAGYRYPGPGPGAGAAVGDLEVEMQWFTRRPGTTVVVGVDKALEMLRHCAGYYDEAGRFGDTWANLQGEAVHDGALVNYGGDPRRVQPVIRARGRYRDFALLETPT